MVPAVIRFHNREHPAKIRVGERGVRRRTLTLSKSELRGNQIINRFPLASKNPPKPLKREDRKTSNDWLFEGAQIRQPGFLAHPKRRVRQPPDMVEDPNFDPPEERHACACGQAQEGIQNVLREIFFGAATRKHMGKTTKGQSSDKCNEASTDPVLASQICTKDPSARAQRGLVAEANIETGRQ